MPNSMKWGNPSNLEQQRERKDYYTVTFKGFKLLDLLSERMKKMQDKFFPTWQERRATDKTSPEWQEYVQLHRNAQMLIRSSDFWGMYIKPEYQEEEEAVLEDLIEGGYIVRASG